MERKAYSRGPLEGFGYAEFWTSKIGRTNVAQAKKS